jgi:regulatory protein
LNTEVLQKLRSFCAYRERAESEVVQKAKALGIHRDEIDKAMEILRREGFVDDQRFAEVFARSKCRQNKWGKFKIKAALIEKRIKAASIEIALTEIDVEAYQTVAKELIDSLLSKGKTAEQIFQSMKNKGYEGELIYSLLQTKGLV